MAGTSAGWETTAPPPDLDDFRMQSRDLYIPAGDNGFWQGAIRNGDDPDREAIAAAIQSGDRLTLEILYGDYEGGQRTITRMAFTSITDGWLCTTSRHWNLDRAHPR